MPAGTCSARQPLLPVRAPGDAGRARTGGPGGSVPHQGRAGHRAPPWGCSPGRRSPPCPSRAFSRAVARCPRTRTEAADTVTGPGWALPVCFCCRHAPVRSANFYCSVISGFISNYCLSGEPHPPLLFFLLYLLARDSPRFISVFPGCRSRAVTVVRSRCFQLGSAVSSFPPPPMLK